MSKGGGGGRKGEGGEGKREKEEGEGHKEEGTKEYILSDFIYIKLKNRQNSFMV